MTDAHKEYHVTVKSEDMCLYIRMCLRLIVASPHTCICNCCLTLCMYIFALIFDDPGTWSTDSNLYVYFYFHFQCQWMISSTYQHLFQQKAAQIVNEYFVLCCRYHLLYRYVWHLNEFKPHLFTRSPFPNISHIVDCIDISNESWDTYLDR